MNIVKKVMKRKNYERGQGLSDIITNYKGSIIYVRGRRADWRGLEKGQEKSMQGAPMANNICDPDSSGTRNHCSSRRYSEWESCPKT